MARKNAPLRSSPSHIVDDAGDVAVRVQRLSYNFGSHWALKDVSFTVRKGDFVYLLGPSGAGKTTLLRLLHAALPVTRGAVMVSGFDLLGLKQHEVPALRRKVSVVFQDFKILPERTVAANVALALEVRGLSKRVIDRRVRAVLRGLNLDHKADCPCNRLSGGEQQRVAVARSVAVNPTILLADEPTGNLDRKLAFRLLEIFRQFHTFGTTVILATHNEELLRGAGDVKTLHLENGRITAASGGMEAVVFQGQKPDDFTSDEACTL